MHAQASKRSHHHAPQHPASALFLAQFSQRLSTLSFDSRPSAPTSQPRPRLKSSRLRGSLLALFALALSMDLLPALSSNELVRPEQVVMEQLRDSGFATIWLVRAQGELFVAEGLSTEGNPVIVHVDPHTGTVLRTKSLSFIN